MTIKVSTVINSHLSDVQATIGAEEETNRTKLNFVKYLVLNYADTSVKIDPDVAWELFKRKHPNL